jgi:Fe-S oxidoreductase
MRRVAQRIREAAIQLKVKRIVFGECGHAWRVAYSFLNTLAGPWDFLDPRYPVPQHICEFTYDLIQEGKLTFDKGENDDKVLTYHDSCNVARASRMGDTPAGSSRSRAPSSGRPATTSTTWTRTPSATAPSAAAAAADC